jgi:hypothetical protein
MLIEAAQQFPTVVFTIGLGVCLIYWLFVLLGALDMDLFGHADVDGGGADVGHDVGGHDVDAGHGHDLDADHGHSSSLWSGLGLSKVPITISISAIMLVCFFLSILGMHYAPSFLGEASWVQATVAADRTARPARRACSIERTVRAC